MRPHLLASYVIETEKRAPEGTVSLYAVPRAHPLRNFWHVECTRTTGRYIALLPHLDWFCTINRTWYNLRNMRHFLHEESGTCFISLAVASMSHVYADKSNMKE